MGLDLRARFNLGSNSRRHPSEDPREPREVTDPHQLRDETSPTWKERFWQFRWYVLTTSAFVVVLTLYLAAVGSQIFVDLLGNPFAQVGLWTLFVAGVTYVAATRRALATIRDVDWMPLVMNESLELWPGEHVPAGEQERYEKFIPYKGFTLMGHLSQPLTIGDLDPSLANSWKAPDRQLDDPAIVRLDPDFGVHGYTDYGHVVAQISNGLAVEGYGKDAHIVATLPDMADEGRMEDLREQVENQRELKRHYEDLAETYKQQTQNALEFTSQSPFEIVEQAIEWGERVADAGRRRPRSLEEEEGDVPPIDRDLGDVDGGES